jgi:hypothetical protein
MKIYIISAVILFCNNALAMDKTKKRLTNLTNDPFVVIVAASGYQTTSNNQQDVTILTHNVINTYNKTQSRNRPCTLKRLLSPCRYNPFRSKF